MRTALLTVQALTFVALGVLLVAEGNPRLGAAQLLLAVVQVVVYL